MIDYKELLDILRKKDEAKHHLNKTRNFPFYTREPERPKYKGDFNEIIGMVARCSLGKNILIDDIREEYNKNIVSNLDLGGLKPEEVIEIFKLDFNSVNRPYIFLYYPINTETKRDVNESKGKKVVAEFITYLFDLHENDKWKNFISDKSTSNVYEEYIIKSLPYIEDSGGKPNLYNFFEKDNYIDLFNDDLDFLMSDSILFTGNIGHMISYYFFTYIIYEFYYMNVKERKPVELYYAFNNERVSGGRLAVKNGYNRVIDKSKQTLLENDFLDFINTCTEENNYLQYYEIYNNSDIKLKTKNNLAYFYKEYLIIKEMEENRDINNATFDELVSEFRKVLEIKNISAETSSRYRKSFDEFRNLGFIKRRGRHGYVLNLTEETLLLFVKLIVRDKEKILLNNFFIELEKRKVFLDKASRTAIISYFEEINILEKLSDSGDAQYVKSIL